MAKSPTITPKQCKQVLRYDPETGKLYWLERPIDMFNDVVVNGGLRTADAAQSAFNVKFAGKEAFTAKNEQGYHVGSIFGKMQRAHRVAWAIVHGYWPTQIDHINGQRCDNRLVNLRDVSNALNHRNEGKPRNNTSGVMGVFWCKQTKMWRATIKLNYRQHHIGRFRTIEEAAIARNAAERELSFDTGHGARDSFRP